MQLNPYLTFNGQCETAFKFYEKCLGGKIEAMVRHTGTPTEQHVPPEWREKIMHARLTVNGEVLTGSDAPPITIKSRRASPFRFSSRTSKMQNGYFMRWRRTGK
jgi:uncharacterized glyoxalase superfamily protein PhnB